ncbi:hypothetical protein TWF225_002221 [Orbilia oligospora]|uniref:Uncharacterized protein n=1 Tax=Orbilia oligospora TaxID=2813651 RepID=A0A8H2DT78_ORBOL|nr:hypothetical protein TWF225_002221 [Orbilia oligospora]KAF3257915.1 hypothetical protein TWF128_004827 [Orbilia oligospora]KAF3289234.1 hypothetical protein TWF132_007674 [Orbilia oligospora]TGJ65876.1 hypothetical protein EYR41_009813 [Orbilia oligospora]
MLGGIEQIENTALKELKGKHKLKPKSRSRKRVNSQIFPGPTKAILLPTILAGGPTHIHIWIAATEPSGILTTYTISTPSPKPTLVYNCNIVPALCNAAEKHLGVGVATTTLIYDRWKPERVDGVKMTKGRSRVDERRKYACGKGGRRLLPLEEHRSALRCPAINSIFGEKTQKVQPGSFTVQSKVIITTKIAEEVVVSTTYTPVVFPVKFMRANTVVLNDGEEDMATKTVENKLAIETEVNGVMVKERIPYKFSCEEFPPATSIQGGIGADTYCAQIRQPMGFATEQNWQGSAIAGLRNYAQKSMHGFDPQQKNSYTTTNTLFEYDFEMRYSNGRGAVWIEGGSTSGDAEYCYGPWGPNPKDCRGIQDNTVPTEHDVSANLELRIQDQSIVNELDLEGERKDGISHPIKGSLNGPGSLRLQPETRVLGVEWDFGTFIGPEGS